MRFTAGGQLDTSFGMNGLLTVATPWGVSGYPLLHPLAVRPDGTLLVGCTLATNRNDDIAVLSLNSDGTVDSSFGTDGVADFDIAGDSVDRVICMQLAPDGDLLVGGSVQVTDGVLLRLKPDGSLDPSFGKGGMVVESGQGTSYLAVRGIAQLPGGGYATLNCDPDPGQPGALVRRYSASGVADTAFGIAGWATTVDASNPAGPIAAASQIAAQSDGSILLAGTRDDGYPTYNDVWVSRFAPNGVLDTGFGVNGQATTDLGGADDCAAAAVGPDGKLVVAGYSVPSSIRAARIGGAPNVGAATKASEGLVRYTCGPSPLLRGPRTFALAKTTVVKGRRAKFSYRINALTLKAKVTIKIFKGKKLKLKVSLGTVRTNRVASGRSPHPIKLARGKYVWKVYAVDQRAPQADRRRPQHADRQVTPGEQASRAVRFARRGRDTLRNGVLRPDALRRGVLSLSRCAAPPSWSLACDSRVRSWGKPW